MGNLSVAIYHPRNQTLGLYHWALCLSVDKESTVLQIVGEPCNFRYEEISAVPESSAHHIQNIWIAEIDDEDYFFQVVRDQKIENEMCNWDCQQWTMEVLESLADNGLMTDYDHDEAKGRLNPHFGAKVEDEYED
ncbi:hypothetical protein MferCBS31731_001964 [Microsporum ferrugineum]